MNGPRIAILMWPDTFEDWYRPLGVERQDYLDGYDREWVYGAAAALRAAGAEVHVVHGTRDAPGTGTQRGSGAIVHFVRAAPAYRALRQAVWGHRWWERAQRVWGLAPLASTLSPRLLGALVRLRPDAVVVQDYETLRFDVAAAVLPALGVRVVAMDTGGSSRPSERPWKPWTARRAGALLAVNAREAARARERLGHPRVDVWPAPLRPAILREVGRAEARGRLGLAPGERVVLAVGRLHPVKGLHDLARACAPLDASLVLVGTGGEEASLLARAQRGLRLAGAVTMEELRDWYAAADVVALASHQEGMPLTVLEALAAGRGVVATDVGGVAEVVRDGETGWLVPPRNVGALRAALAAALDDPAEADRRGAAGRAGVLERHAPEAAGRELLRLILDGARS